MSVLPLKSIMHVGMSDVSGSRRDPCPALRMMALLIVMEEVLDKMEARKRAKQAAAPKVPQWQKYGGDSRVGSTITTHTIMPTPKHALSYVRACRRTQQNRPMPHISWPKTWTPKKGHRPNRRIFETNHESSRC